MTCCFSELNCENLVENHSTGIWTQIQHKDNFSHKAWLIHVLCTVEPVNSIGSAIPVCRCNTENQPNSWRLAPPGSSQPEVLNADHLSTFPAGGLKHSNPSREAFASQYSRIIELWTQYFFLSLTFYQFGRTGSVRTGVPGLAQRQVRVGGPPLDVAPGVLRAVQVALVGLVPVAHGQQ